MNVCSLRSKIDEIRYMCLNDKIDCLCISESHLSCSVPDNVVFIPGYTIYRKDRVDKAGGGVLIYASNDYVSCLLKNLCDPEIEALWIEFKLPKIKSFIVSCVYRPPQSPVKWFDSFEPILHRVSITGKNLIMTGDFNIDLLRNDHLIWKELYTSFNFIHLIDIPTRVVGESAALLDHIYVTNKDMAALWFISNIALSDHFPIGMVCNKTLANKTTNNSNYHTYINYNKVIDYDYPKFDEFIYIDENLDLQDLDVNGRVNILTNVLTNYNLRRQTISKRAKRPKQMLVQ